MADHAHELYALDAHVVVEKLRREELSPHDLLDVLEARIAAVDGAVNALPTLCFDRARKAADALLRKPVAERGILCGLPVPIKDMVDVAGVRTTNGSRIYADFVPERSDIVVERLEANGAIIYAKSNTPEFGAGGHTDNEVFGMTRNPWDLGRSVSGSSGGAAAALASGTAWLAHGSDMGGSCRTPASFCGVVGLRPSVGRVARVPFAKVDRTIAVEGPLARGVEDAALFLDAMAGEHPMDPLSLPDAPGSFRAAACGGWKPKRVAYSATLGITAVDPEIESITRRAALRLQPFGIAVEDDHPDFSEAHDCNRVLRAFDYVIRSAGLLRDHRALIKPHLVANIEAGLALRLEDVEQAERQRLALYLRTVRFFERYDCLITPATIVAAYPADQSYVAECNGHTFGSYFEWMALSYAISLIFCPAISIPCGFTKSGLPVGLQIVAPPRRDDRLLAIAKLLEDELGMRGTTPIAPRQAAA